MNSDLARAQQLDLLRLRLLHLQDHVGLGEHRLGVGHDARALGLVGVVVDRAALAGAGLRSAPRGRARAAPGAPAGVSATRYSSALISVGTPTFIAAPLPRSVEPSTSNAVPRRSSSGNRSSGSTQRSGGSAPRASIRPRASSRTAAAAGAPVETTPPPSPHALDGRRSRRAPYACVPRWKPRPRARRRCRAEGGSASAAARLRSARAARRQLAQRSEHGRREREAEARLAAAEAVAERAQLGVQRVDRVARPRSARRSPPAPPSLSGSISMRPRRRAARPARIVSSSTRVCSA